jgi:hypothetical protein
MHLAFGALDLQSYWMRVTDGFLNSIVERCTNLQRLSLSWSGGGQNLLSPYGFTSFISTAGTLRVFQRKFTLEDAICSHAGLLEALACV